MNGFTLPPLTLPVNNAPLQQGMNDAAAIVAAGVAKINSNLRALQGPARGLNSFVTGSGIPGVGNQGINPASLQSMATASSRLNVSLDRIGRQFSGGLGLGTVVGGFALLERGMDKAINKAKEYQTATLAIAATLSSLGSRTDVRSGKTLSPEQTFRLNLREAENIRREILTRSTKNILTFQEQLNSFEASLNPGTRKGLTTKQTMDLSERSAVVAKTLGLRGEQIAHASRLLLGGGVNVARSTIGRALGIQNQDIAGRYGDQLFRFLDTRMKGFKQAEGEFAGSIEGILSTIESRVDTVLGMAGERFFKNKGVSTTLQKVLSAVDRPEKQNGESDADFDKRLKQWEKDAAQLDGVVDSLADLFTKLFNAISKLANSPEAKVFQQFLRDVAQHADLIVLAGVFVKIGAAIRGASQSLQGFATNLSQIANGNLVGGLLGSVPGSRLAQMAGAQGGPALAGRGAGIGGVSSAEAAIFSKLASLPAHMSAGAVLNSADQREIRNAPPGSRLHALGQSTGTLFPAIDAVQTKFAAQRNDLARQAQQIQTDTAKKLVANQQKLQTKLSVIEQERLRLLVQAEQDLRKRGKPGTNASAFSNAWNALYGGGGYSPVGLVYDPQDIAAHNAERARIDAEAAQKAQKARAGAQLLHNDTVKDMRSKLGGVAANLQALEAGRLGGIGSLLAGVSGTNIVPSASENFKALRAERLALLKERDDLMARQRSGNAGLTRKPGELRSDFAARNAQILALQADRLQNIADDLQGNRVAVGDIEGLRGVDRVRQGAITGYPELRNRLALGASNIANRAQNYGGLALTGGLAAYELNALGRNNDNPVTRTLQLLGSGALGGASLGGLVGGVPGAGVGATMGAIIGAFQSVTAVLGDFEKQAELSGRALADMRGRMPVSTQEYLSKRDARRNYQQQIREQNEEPYSWTTDLRRSFDFGLFRSRDTTDPDAMSPSQRRRLARLRREEADANIQASPITNPRLEQSERAAMAIANADAAIKQLNASAHTSLTSQAIRDQELKRRLATISKNEADRQLLGGVDAYLEPWSKQYAKRYGAQKTPAQIEAFERARNEKIAEYDVKAMIESERLRAQAIDVHGIDSRVAKFQERAGVAQLLGNGPLAGILSTFAGATDATRNMPASARGDFMREVVRNQAKQLTMGLAGDLMQRQQTQLAMAQFPMQARLALANHAREGEALQMEGAKLKLRAKQLILEDTNIELAGRRLALAVPQLDLRAEQLQLDAQRAILDNENAGIAAGRNRRRFDLLNNPVQDQAASFEDMSRRLQGQIGFRAAQRNLVSAQDAPALFYGGMGPVSGIAAQLRYRVESRFAKNFNPGEYEAAYQRQIQNQLAGMQDDQLLAQNRAMAAKIEIVKNEVTLAEATQALIDARIDAAQAMKSDAMNPQAAALAAKGRGMAATELGLAYDEAAAAKKGQAYNVEAQAFAKKENASALAALPDKLAAWQMNGAMMVVELEGRLLDLSQRLVTLTDAIKEKQGALSTLQGEAGALNIPVDVSIMGLTRDDLMKELPTVVRKAIEDWHAQKQRVPSNK